jgi:hypothetical protein
MSYQGPPSGIISGRLLGWPAYVFLEEPMRIPLTHECAPVSIIRSRIMVRKVV